MWLNGCASEDKANESSVKSTNPRRRHLDRYIARMEEKRSGTHSKEKEKWRM